VENKQSSQHLKKEKKNKHEEVWKNLPNTPKKEKDLNNLSPNKHPK
jgi:hypothetical protein